MKALKRFDINMPESDLKNSASRLFFRLQTQLNQYVDAHQAFYNTIAAKSNTSWENKFQELADLTPTELQQAAEIFLPVLVGHINTSHRLRGLLGQFTCHPTSAAAYAAQLNVLAEQTEQFRSALVGEIASRLRHMSERLDFSVSSVSGSVSSEQCNQFHQWIETYGEPTQKNDL